MDSFKSIDPDVDILIGLLPQIISDWVYENDPDEIIEIILDLGRAPEVRYLNSFLVMETYLVSRDDISAVIENGHVSDFSKNNRRGVQGTLHRISCIKDRENVIVGLTMRVGKAIEGGIELLRDMIDTGESILLLGRPGVGKSSKLREACKYIADIKNQYVVIVDTSNEIAGEGQVPHRSVGRSRRLMVPYNKDQHEVMIEAVENHMPHVIVIDEISKETEAMAARTVAERGVQLLATAHGETLENLIKNKPLAALVGKVNGVTVSDEAARQLDGRKTVLEREYQPTFTKLVELLDYDRVAVHHSVEEAIDHLLAGSIVIPELRQLIDGKCQIIQQGVYRDVRPNVFMEDNRRSSSKTQVNTRPSRRKPR